MDTHRERAEALWADLVATAEAPLDVVEIAELFRTVGEGAASAEVAVRLGPAHAVVRLAAGLVAGTAGPVDPDRAALAVVVAAALVAPGLMERSGTAPSPAEATALADLARAAFENEVGGV